MIYAEANRTTYILYSSGVNWRTINTTRGTILCRKIVGTKKKGYVSVFYSVFCIATCQQT